MSGCFQLLARGDSENITQRGGCCQIDRPGAATTPGCATGTHRHGEPPLSSRSVREPRGCLVLAPTLDDRGHAVEEVVSAQFVLRVVELRVVHGDGAVPDETSARICLLYTSDAADE